MIHIMLLFCDQDLKVIVILTGIKSLSSNMGEMNIVLEYVKPVVY
jgi:hypothetical protein